MQMQPHDKVLITNFAAYKAGIPRIEYPLHHTLIFYLMHNGFKFPGYLFAPRYWPGAGDCLMSSELTQDTGLLVAGGLVTISANPFVQITEQGLREATGKKERLREDNESYEGLAQLTREALRQDRTNFLEICYNLYITLEYVKMGQGQR